MPNNQEKTQKLVPILIIALVVILLLSLINNILRKANDIQFTSANIDYETQMDIDSSIIFTFSKEISQAQVQITPRAQFLQAIKNNTLTISPQETWPNMTDYDFFIEVTAKNGSQIDLNYKLKTHQTFEAEAAKKDEELNQTLYPLMSKLPLDTDKYLMYYDDPMLLKVELRYDTTRQDVESEILNWIREMGIDPNTHTIIFK